MPLDKDLAKHICCSGVNPNCKNYIPLRENYNTFAKWKEYYDTCVWYSVIRHDIEKVERGEENTTFNRKSIEELIPWLNIY